MGSQPGCGCSICDEDQESGVPENADRISTQSDPHTYYCAQCRTTFDFHHSPDCTCCQVQQFVVRHRASHDKYPDGYASESAARLRVDLPQSPTMCAVAYQVDTQQHTLDQQRRKRPGNRNRINEIKCKMDQDVLRTRIADAIQQANTEWLTDETQDGFGDPFNFYAVAVIRELGLTEAPASWNIE